MRSWRCAPVSESEWAAFLEAMEPVEGLEKGKRPPPEALATLKRQAEARAGVLKGVSEVARAMLEEAIKVNKLVNTLRQKEKEKEEKKKKKLRGKEVGAGGSGAPKEEQVDLMEASKILGELPETPKGGVGAASGGSRPKQGERL